jgi:UDP-N-acetylglucosamine:LPS N-acetylglucosamine transferase
LKKNENFDSGKQAPRILLAPLDWGLGHATRCIPIIKQLNLLGCEVFIVADKEAYSLLKKEFSDAVILRYKGYEIKYSNRKKYFFLKLMFQIPSVFFKIRGEKRWLKRTIKTYSIDAVISDNRFGMYSKNIPSVYITHQLFIKTGNRLSEIIAQKIHYGFIKKFAFCWVPDSQNNGLAGELSHPKNLPSHVVYLGPLSRFEILTGSDKIYDLLIILSGPEPQRTIFENIILNQINNSEENIFLIRGLPNEKTKPSNFKNTIIENHLPAAALNKVLSKSKLVLCRSGYTSVMDLSILKMKAILVPTPGQTEQEYLAEYLCNKKYFLFEKQESFNITDAMEKARYFPFEKPEFENEAFKKTVNQFVEFLKSKKSK